MLISHRYRFIFIKVPKTAGTSIEIALSKYLGPEDIITPINPDDELVRKELGGRGPQNFLIPPWRMHPGDVRTMIRQRSRPRFYNHAPARFIRNRVRKGVWNSYFKFAFERNPFDRAISLYYWRYRAGLRPPISEWLKEGGLAGLAVPGIYAIDGQSAVDRIFKYEEMAASLEKIAERVSLPETPTLPHTKHTYRTDRRPYAEVLSSDDRQRIVQHYGDHLGDLGYEW